MKSDIKKTRLLGLAFLLQFITSIFSGTILNRALFGTGDMHEILNRIVENPLLLRTYILVDIFTALGIVFLGAVLFITLRKQNEKIALTAFGFYIIEAALLACSRMETFSLLGIAGEYAAAGLSADLLQSASSAIANMEFTGANLHMVVFCIGAILFYYLLVKSKIVPRWLSFWGFISVCLAFIAALISFFGLEVPLFFYIPYMPFEFAAALWILIKGVPEAAYDTVN